MRMLTPELERGRQLCWRSYEQSADLISSAKKISLASVYLQQKSISELPPSVKDAKVSSLHLGG